MSQHPFRFGVVNERVLPAADWIAHVQRVEALGYATLLIRDHFVPDFFGPQLGPIAALATAASVTTRLRVGTLVFDNNYRHSVLLAKEAATLDLLSGGRLELGLGAGWLRAEYAQAGLPFDRAGIRISRLAEAIGVLKGLFADGPLTFDGTHYQIQQLDGFPKPQQRPHPPILIGGGKQRMLTLAGHEADIVSILTTSVASGTVVDDVSERTPEAVAQKIAWISDGAGARFPQIELSLIPTVIVTDQRRERTTQLIHERGWPGVAIEDVWAMPSVLIGSAEQICEDMLARREHFGFSYYVVSDANMEAFVPVVQHLTGM